MNNAVLWRPLDKTTMAVVDLDWVNHWPLSEQCAWRKTPVPRHPLRRSLRASAWPAAPCCDGPTGITSPPKQYQWVQWLAALSLSVCPVKTVSAFLLLFRAEYIHLFNYVPGVFLRWELAAGDVPMKSGGHTCIGMCHKDTMMGGSICLLNSQY